MLWTRLAVALLVVLSFAPASPAGPPAPTPGSSSGHLASAERVRALLPPGWRFQPLPEPAGHRKGLQASVRGGGWSPADLRRPGLEAYWVDATEVGVPSDYYGLAAGGPAMEALRRDPACRPEAGSVVGGDFLRAGVGRRLPAHYVATVVGTCASGHRGTRWASFVAAPGFGPVHEIGIPQSGLYVVTASVREGPRAERRLGRLMRAVSFGGTRVTDLLAAAGARALL